MRRVMYLKVRAHFDAAHNLRDYVGQCSRLHGHTWRVEVIVPVEGELNADGYYDAVTLDFKRIKDVLDDVMPDHDYLNGVFTFNPTAENLALFLQRKLTCRLGVEVSVTVWESEDCGAVAQ